MRVRRIIEKENRKGRGRRKREHERNEEERGGREREFITFVYNKKITIYKQNEIKYVIAICDIMEFIITFLL